MHLLLLFASIAIAANCPAVAPVCGVTQVQSSRRFYCGSRGSVSNVKVIQPACTVDSLDQCRDSCLSNNQCVSFGYYYNSKSGGQCTLYSTGIKKQNFTPSPKSNTVFYNKHCFASAACLGPSNTAFCSSYLSIPVVTTTTTTTITPDDVTVTTSTTATTDPVTTATTSTDSEVTVTTSTETDQQTITTTITTTSFSPTRVQCLSSATNFAATTSTIIPPDGSSPDKKLGKREIKKHILAPRAAPNPVPTPSCLRNAPPSAVSSACSCQSISTSTTTTTTTVMATADTTTMVITTTETPVVTDATTTTTTSTSITTTTVVLDLTTVTYTQVMVQPTPATFRGLFYAPYQNQYDYDNDDPGFDATTWNGNPNYGTTGLITALNSYCFDQCPLPGQTTDYNYQQLTLVMVGFFFSPTTDSYTLCVENDIDNGFYLWSGDVAYSSYNNNNWDGFAERAGFDSSNYHGTCVTYDLNAGDFLPVTYIFVNGGGASNFNVDVTSSTATTDTSGYFVPPCDGSPFVV